MLHALLNSMLFFQCFRAFVGWLVVMFYIGYVILALEDGYAKIAVFLSPFVFASIPLAGALFKAFEQWEARLEQAAKTPEPTSTTVV